MFAGSVEVGVSTCILSEEEFEKGGFNLKTHQMFPSTLRWRNLKKDIIFGFVFEENSVRKITRIIVTTSFSKSFVRARTQRRRLQIPPVCRAFSKIMFSFRDGLVWTVGLNVEIKLRLQISPPHYERCLNDIQV